MEEGCVGRVEGLRVRKGRNVEQGAERRECSRVMMREYVLVDGLV